MFSCRSAWVRGERTRKSFRVSPFFSSLVFIFFMQQPRLPSVVLYLSANQRENLYDKGRGGTGGGGAKGVGRWGDGGEWRGRRKTGGEEGWRWGKWRGGGEPLQLANVMSIYERSRTAGLVQGPVSKENGFSSGM